MAYLVQSINEPIIYLLAKEKQTCRDTVWKFKQGSNKRPLTAAVIKHLHTTLKQKKCVKCIHKMIECIKISLVISVL